MVVVPSVYCLCDYNIYPEKGKTICKEAQHPTQHTNQTIRSEVWCVTTNIYDTDLSSQPLCKQPVELLLHLEKCISSSEIQWCCARDF